MDLQEHYVEGQINKIQAENGLKAEQEKKLNERKKKIEL